MNSIINRIGNETKVYAKTFEDEAYQQVLKLANYEPYLHSKIRIMPDSHAGKGCTVGTTMTLTNMVTPNLVGVDIGCGMYVVQLKEPFLDLPKLDAVINEHIPSGFNIRNKSPFIFDLSDLICLDYIDTSRAANSIGTLGGGNHFIEVAESDDGDLYLVIHTGSRNLGLQVCKYYQTLAYNNLNKYKSYISKEIDRLKSEGREKDIQMLLKSMERTAIDKELAYLDDVPFHNYIHDMQIVQDYASYNRVCIASIILKEMQLHEKDSFETVHNYINVGDMILRKGAVSANLGERLIIPINMRDGSLICIGKGNEDWNCSAPHGAGRLMSRSKAKQNISMDEFKSSMDGIYTTSVCNSTLDEAPQSYKSMDEIISQIGDTVDVEKIIKPIYNFKAK